MTGRGPALPAGAPAGPAGPRSTRRTCRLLARCAAGLVGGLVAAGCGAGGGHGAPARPAAAGTRPTGPAAGRPTAATALDSCPGSTATVVRHGPPAVTLACLGPGPAVHLAGLRGRPTLVNLWASWCPPCQAEVPALQAVYAAAAGRLGVLGVDVADQRAAALSFAAAVGMRYPSVVDPRQVTLTDLGVPGPPVTLFVTAAGVVVYVQYGPLPAAGQLRRELADRLGVRVG